jgi:hypothetical protein
MCVTIEDFFDALNEFGWLVGDLNYDNTAISGDGTSSWRFPLPKSLHTASNDP